MKTVLFIVLIVLVVFIVIDRDRIYLRDPLATVYRNGVPQDGVEVYQNYSNDILLEKESDPGAFRLMIQRWERLPGIPVRLTCFRWVACLTESEHAPTVPIPWTGKSGSPASESARGGDKGKYDPKISMTKYEVSFVDADATTVRVTLK